MSDPVASKSGFLCMYMSNHPDTLVSYVRHFGKINDAVTSAEMKSIETKGMMLAYKTKGSGDAKKEVFVDFDPPLSGYEEVKPRLLSMKVDAEEALGMSKAPQITEFHFPRSAVQTAVLLGLLAYTVYSPAPSSASWHPAFKLGWWLKSSLPSWFIPSVIRVALTVHILEALYTTVLCRRHKTPFFVGVQWVVTNFIFGYPVLFELRRRIQAAKIESIIKGQ